MSIGHITFGVVAACTGIQAVLKGYRLHGLNISRRKREELVEALNRQHLPEDRERAQRTLQNRRAQLAAADDDIHRQEQAYNAEASKARTVLIGVAAAVVAYKVLDTALPCASKWLFLDKEPCQLFRENLLQNDTTDTQTLWVYADYVGSTLIEKSGETVVLAPGERH